MKEIKAPMEYRRGHNKTVVFLAGSIEMGKAVNWQTRLAEELAHLDNLLLLNPRRDDWDSSWVQSIHNERFREQVEWELNGLENADIIVFYFDKDTKSPITLLELGLFVRKNIIVCCPKSFWRKGNVDMVCEKYGVKIVETIEDLIAELLKRLPKRVQESLTK